MESTTNITYAEAFWKIMRDKNTNYTVITEGENGANGHYAPSAFTEEFTVALSQHNLFRRLSTTISLSSAEGSVNAVSSAGTAAWMLENEYFPDAANTCIQFSVKSHKLAALTRLKENFVLDFNFDIERYLLIEFSRKFGQAEESAFINGDGVNQPAGILTNGEVSVTTSGTAVVTYDEIAKLYLSLKPEYRRNAVFLMNDETALYLRTLKDIAGNVIWQSDDDTIFGRPAITSPYMPTMAAGAKAIAFGDLSFYWIIMRQPLTLRRLGELYARESQIGFTAFERLDGKLVRPEAVKIIQINE